ncbi:MAG: GMP/IMP nucleotidase [Psychromonas sp.]
MHLITDIDTVLLDMDGTLLDLHYDNHFWMEFVPEQYADKANISLPEAHHFLSKQYHKLYGTIDWYCYDQWSSLLDLNIHQLQHQTNHKVQIRSDTLAFLTKLKQLNKRIIILTNAHRSGVEMKMQITGLSPYFDKIISSHDYQIVKENLVFWATIQEQLKLDFSRCLFIDDNEHILKVAQQAGVGHLCGIEAPDSKKPAQTMQEFKVLHLFNELFT